MYEILKEDIKEAMVAKSGTAAFLRTIKSDVDALAKKDQRQPTNADVYAVAKKFFNATNETIEALREQGREADEEMLKERAILEKFLPQLMPKEMLRGYIIAKVDAYGKDKKTIGLVMKDLKTEFPNEYDGKLANQIIKELLS